MKPEIQEKLKKLSAFGKYKAGINAFNDNAVLDMRRDGKVVEARVANSGGRFERVQIQFKGKTLNIKCSCSRRSTAYCEHAVASLFQLDKDDPELLESVLSDDRKIDVDMPAEATNGEYPQALTPVQSVRNLSWKSVLDKPESTAQADVQIQGPAPTLDSRWSRIELHISLLFNHRKYSASNMKQLVEVGTGAGGMQIDDFSLQEQQLMRFLVSNTELVGNRHILNSYDLADVFHCLSGANSIQCRDGRISIHPDPVELVLMIKHENERNFVIPRFLLRDQGVLPTSEVKQIVGRGGCWIGIGTDYWWLPGVADAPWLRSLLKDSTGEVEPRELQRLTDACEQRRIPARLMPHTAAEEIKPEPGECHPMLTLDWKDENITADIEFEYERQRVPVDGPELIWSRNRFIERDQDAEHKAQKKLAEMGFQKDPRISGQYYLDTPDNLWDFLENRFNEIEDKWEVFYSTRFNRKRTASGNLSMHIKTHTESESWFEIDCSLKTGNGELIDLEQVLDSIRNRHDFVRLKSGAVARLNEEIRYAVEFFFDRSEGRHKKRFQFGRFAAHPLADAVAPFVRGRPAEWQLQARSLQEAPDPENLNIPSESLEKTLRDYQKEGVAWLAMLESNGFHGILADEMGLGKTIQALTILLRRIRNNKIRKPSLVVCPTSLVENWFLEAKKFIPDLNVVTIEGADRLPTLQRLKNFDLAITSYALLRRDIEEYNKFKFDYLVLDEAQHIKNPQTANAKTCKSLQAEHRLILTGTPIENSLREIWSLFDFLQPGMLGTQKHFHERYELAASPDEEVDRAQELARQIRPFILRRTKIEVCKQLPPKIEQIVYCELDKPQRKLYTDILSLGNRLMLQAREDGFRKSRMELLSLLMRLRQACCHPDLLPPEFRPKDNTKVDSAKTELLKEIILEAIDGDHRMLVFSQFTGMLQLIIPWLDEQSINYEYLDGSTKNRLDKVNKFNNDPSTPVFLISLKAGGTGLNLTGADTVIHYDQWWNPMVEDQATDRTHRIGQERPVTAIKLVAHNTIEEKILALQEEKRDLFNQLIGGAPAKLGDLTPEDFEFLFER